MLGLGNVKTKETKLLLQSPSLCRRFGNPQISQLLLEITVMEVLMREAHKNKKIEEGGSIKFWKSNECSRTGKRETKLLARGVSGREKPSAAAEPWEKNRLETLRPLEEEGRRDVGLKTGWDRKAFRP